MFFVASWLIYFNRNNAQLMPAFLCPWYVLKDITLIYYLPYYNLALKIKKRKKYYTNQLFAFYATSSVSKDLTLTNCPPFPHFFLSKDIILISCLPFCHFICFKIYHTDHLLAFFTSVLNDITLSDAHIVFPWYVLKDITLISSVLY